MTTVTIEDVMAAIDSALSTDDSLSGWSAKRFGDYVRVGASDLPQVGSVRVEQVLLPVRRWHAEPSLILIGREELRTAETHATGLRDTLAAIDSALAELQACLVCEGTGDGPDRSDFGVPCCECGGTGIRGGHIASPQLAAEDVSL